MMHNRFQREMAQPGYTLMVSRIEEPDLDCRTVYTETYPVFRQSAQLEL